ncbi:hypothetical protein AVEN_263654-1 [Araneus ventricosus]|uniref:Uncharacterized protein n=1 Tax=Araneus ventricosus TaxID=182803 RepID=A0A4Y2AS00_ARAVE|nr:hypothetical protein AVEN_263654-1 [Araneus ventricosus]
MSHLKRYEGYFGTVLLIANRGEMTKTTPEATFPSPNFHATPAGGGSTLNLTCIRLTYMAESRFEHGPSGAEAETLPLCQRGSSIKT